MIKPKKEKKSESVKAPDDRALINIRSCKSWLPTKVMLSRIRERVAASIPPLEGET